MYLRTCVTFCFFLPMLSGCGGSTPTKSTSEVKLPGDGKDAAKTSDPIEAFKKAGGAVFLERGKVEGLRLPGPAGNAATMKMLENFPGAERLELLGVAAKGPDFEVLRKLPDLKILNMSRCAVDDDTLKIVGKLTKLSTLQLERTKITAQGLNHLRKLKHLSVVSLDETKLEGSDLAVFADQPKLEVLSLSDTGIGNEALASLSKLPLLRTLRLNGCKKIGDEGLVHLHSVKTLMTVYVQGTSVTERGIQALTKAVPAVQVRK